SFLGAPVELGLSTVDDRLEGPDIASGHEAGQLGKVAPGEFLAHGSSSPPLAAGMAVIIGGSGRRGDQPARPAGSLPPAGAGPRHRGPRHPHPLVALPPFLLSAHPFGPSFLP